MLTSADVKSKCGHANSTLGSDTEFTSVGFTRIKDCMCPTSSSSNDRVIYTGPILGSSTGGKCPAYKCKCADNCKDEEYDCDKGFENDPFYALFCKYSP